MSRVAIPFVIGNSDGMHTRRRFIAKLKALMDEAGLSQTELGKKVGLSQSTVNKWLEPSGTGYPRPPDLPRVARALNCTIDYLLDDQTTEPGGSSRDLSRDQMEILELTKGMPCDFVRARMMGFPYQAPRPEEPLEDDAPPQKKNRG